MTSIEDLKLPSPRTVIISKDYLSNPGPQIRTESFKTEPIGDGKLLDHPTTKQSSFRQRLYCINQVFVSCFISLSLSLPLPLLSLSLSLAIDNLISTWLSISRVFFEWFFFIQTSWKAQILLFSSVSQSQPQVKKPDYPYLKAPYTHLLFYIATYWIFIGCQLLKLSQLSIHSVI